MTTKFLPLTSYLLPSKTILYLIRPTHLEPDLIEFCQKPKPIQSVTSQQLSVIRFQLGTRPQSLHTARATLFVLDP